MHLRRSLLASCLGLLLALASCVSVAPALPAPAAPTASRLWLVRDLEAILAAVPLPPALAPEPPPASPDQALLDAWREPATRWLDAELRAIVAEGLYPTRAARSLMLLGVAMNDAAIAAAAARESGAQVSEHAAVGAAAARVLAFSHPLMEALSPAEQEAAVWAGLWRGEDTVPGVLAGQSLGVAVADQVLAWAASDGSSEPRLAFVAPRPGPGIWAATPPNFDQPQDPGWGQVRTVAIGASARLRAPVPPAWDSPLMRAQIAEFAAAQEELSAEQRALALKWAGGSGTVTPSGLWAQRAQVLVAGHKLPLAQAAAVYAALGVALHDAAVTCWESKFHYMVARPVQGLGGPEANRLPLLVTPPHPSYPSGHAAFSGAASAVLAEFFPAEAAALRLEAQEAARSRVYAGIHWPMDGEAGLAQGEQVAASVLELQVGP